MKMNERKWIMLFSLKTSYF